MDIPYATTSTFDVAIADANSAAVEGATVTLTIEDSKTGVAVVTDTSMSDIGSGNYSYTVSSTLLPKAEHVYFAKVTGTSGSYSGYAEIRLYTEVDRT